MAYSASSRIWFTVSHGILNEIYYPTIDRPQTRDMEFLITDGETFVHEEKRDLERTFEYIDSCSSAVRLINSDHQGRYRIIKEVIADPHHPVVLMRVRFEGEERLLSRMKAYALLAPHLDVGGADNSGMVLDLSGKLTLLATKHGLSLVMAASCGFSRASCGFVGRSDGWQDLMDNFQMDWQFGSAMNGNIALTGEIDVAHHREFVVAIALGEGHHSALTTALGSVTTPFEQNLKRFNDQWHRAGTPADLKGAAMDAGRLLQVSQNVILSHEDKYYSGAFIASASIPGASTRAMMMSVDTTWCGRAIWCRAPLRCWPAIAWIRHAGPWCTWPAPSARMAASRKISGSTAPLTGRAFSWTR